MDYLAFFSYILLSTLAFVPIVIIFNTVLTIFCVVFFGTLRVARGQKFITQEMSKNLLKITLNITIIIPIVHLFVTFLFLYVLPKGVILWRPLEDAHLFWQFLIMLLLFEFAHYFKHFLAHRYSLPWKSHRYHHQFVKKINWTEGLVEKPIFYASMYATLISLMYILGTGIIAPAIVIAVFWFNVALAHTEADWTLGPFKYFFLAPRHHHIHHAISSDYTSDVDTAYVSGRALQYGVSLSVFDYIFGTAVYDEENYT